MNQTIRDIIGEMEALEEKLKHEIDIEEMDIAYELKNGYVKFEEKLLKRQKKVSKSLIRYFSDIPLMHLFSSPLVYAIVFPALFLDIMLFMYQNVIFRIYRFEFVKRSDYIVFDRHYLSYLNIVEKINCMYCSYFNGLMHYAAEIAAKTELYFCPIKHAKKTIYRHRFYKDFFAYGDEIDYQDKLEKVRQGLQK